MQDGQNIFINSALEEGFKLYLSNKDKEYSLDFNRFVCSVIRMLIMIYGENIIKSYEEKNVQLFDDTLIKYGYDVTEANNFKVIFEGFYKLDLRHQKKAIKKKNKYFNLVQKYLIDMMVKRNQVEKLGSLEMNEFYDLLFTANSKDFYRKSTAVLMAYNPYEIDEYVKKQGIVVG